MAAIERILAALLDKTGRKWKTIIGLAATLLILLSGQAGWMTDEQVQAWVPWALGLTGIGLFHKAAGK